MPLVGYLVKGNPPMKRNLGFTLIEIMVVIAIIGLLLSFALPQYQNYLRKAALDGAVTRLNDMAGLVDRYYAANQRWPAKIAGIVVSTNPQSTSVVRPDTDHKIAGFRAVLNTGNNTLSVFARMSSDMFPAQPELVYSLRPSGSGMRRACGTWQGAAEFKVDLPATCQRTGLSSF